ncbi:MAG: patatin family protein [Desulfobacteraceae bacterium]|nr:patatin family protein [Desulfobacteraceae bacterium]MBU4055751.1 patatin family protein [Pseudomonadota bacterium]
MKISKRFSDFFDRCFRPFPSHLRKKALVLEGGGMRGVFLTGVLQAFTDKHYFPWEIIIGSSAGALNGALYASDQIHLARDAFFTYIPSADFINFSNVIHPDKHILDIDWIIETIINGDDPMDIKMLKKCCPVLITATDCTPYTKPKTVYLNSREDDIVTALKATAAVPYLYRGFVKYRNHQFLDGALLDPIPFKKALDLGYKEEDILVVMSHYKGYRKSQESFWVKTLYENYYKDEKYRYLVEALDQRFIGYNAIIDDLYLNHPGISILYPPEQFKLNRISHGRVKLAEGFEFGVSAAKKWLGLKAPHPPL